MLLSSMTPNKGFNFNPTNQRMHANANTTRGKNPQKVTPRNAYIKNWILSRSRLEQQILRRVGIRVLSKIADRIMGKIGEDITEHL